MRGHVILTVVCMLAAGVAPTAAAAPPAERTVLVLGSPSGPVERALLGGLRQRRLGIVRAAAFGPAAEAADPDEAVVKRVEANLGRAQKLFYAVRIVDAAELLEQQIRAASFTLARARRLDLLRALHLWDGVCLLKKGDDRGARGAFASAVLLDERPPDDVRFAPVVITTFAEVRKELERQPRGLLVVQVTPRTARVTVDGRPLLAESARLSPGRHWIVAEGLSHLPTVRELHVAGGQTARLALTLHPADRQLVRRQLHALAARGELDALAPEIALALCRMQDADEVLLAREGRDGGRLRLSFTRLSCASGKTLGKQEETTAPDRAERAAQHALATLWPVTPGGPGANAKTTTPVYKRWWFWTLIGLGTAAAVGGTVAGVLATRGPDTYTIRMSP